MSTPNKIHYKWEELHDDVTKIANWSKSVGFRPDSVVGIIRGGAIPAVILSHIFNCPVHLVDYSLRDGKIRNNDAIDNIGINASHGKKFLIIDDIVDSGETLAQIKERLTGNDKNIIYTSLWYNPNQTKATINFWARVIDRSSDNRWIMFPYE